MASSDTNPDDKGTILTTLVRGLSVLEVVASSNGTATAKAISRSLGLKSSTCYHLLRTLRARRYVVRTPEGYWDIGPQAGSLSHRVQSRSGPQPELASVLTRLHNRTAETVYITGWFHNQIVIQQFLDGGQALRVHTLDVGYGENLHARASCHAVLAFLPPEQVEVMFSGISMAQLTSNTVTSYEQLIETLVRVRQQGYALDLEAFAEGVCCVSAPFFDQRNLPAGSLTVSIPKNRFDARADFLIGAVRESALMATAFLETGRLTAPVRARTAS